MADTFQTIPQIAGTWGLDAENARTAVFTELDKIKGPALHPHPSSKRVLGLDREAVRKG